MLQKPVEVSADVSIVDGKLAATTWPVRHHAGQVELTVQSIPADEGPARAALARVLTHRTADTNKEVRVNAIGLATRCLALLHHGQADKLHRGIGVIVLRSPGMATAGKEDLEVGWCLIISSAMSITK